MHGLIDLIFPPNCAGCDKPGVLLCAECASRVEYIDSRHACPNCGAPAMGRCEECGGRTFPFSEARCAALLQPPVSRTIVLLKDAGERRYAQPLSELLARSAEGWLREGEVLVPVPASPAAIRRRGFDHAADVARGLGRLSGFPVHRVLVASATADQRRLGRADRFSNRAGSFALSDRRVPDRIVLVDDVLTTGATMEAAASALLAGGASAVRALAVARAVRPCTARAVPPCP